MSGVVSIARAWLSGLHVVRLCVERGGVVEITFSYASAQGPINWDALFRSVYRLSFETGVEVGGRIQKQLIDWPVHFDGHYLIDLNAHEVCCRLQVRHHRVMTAVSNVEVYPERVTISCGGFAYGAYTIRCPSPKQSE